MLAIDTSALLKRYVDEPGRSQVLATMDSADVWCVSAVAVAEARIALCRVFEGQPLEQALSLLDGDMSSSVVVPADDRCLERAAEIGCLTGTRTLDAIHLAAADRLPRPVRFLTVASRQRSAAEALEFDVLPG